MRLHRPQSFASLTCFTVPEKYRNDKIPDMTIIVYRPFVRLVREAPRVYVRTRIIVTILMQLLEYQSRSSGD